ITIVRSSESRERLVTHMSGNNAAKTSTAPLTLILSADSDFHEHFPTTFPVAPDARDNFARMPVEARESAADLNASLQIAYLIMGVRAAGLAAGPMTGFDAEGVRTEFFGKGPSRSRSWALTSVSPDRTAGSTVCPAWTTGRPPPRSDPLACSWGGLSALPNLGFPQMIGGRPTLVIRQAVRQLMGERVPGSLRHPSRNPTNQERRAVRSRSRSRVRATHVPR